MDITNDVPQSWKEIEYKHMTCRLYGIFGTYMVKYKNVEPPQKIKNKKLVAKYGMKESKTTKYDLNKKEIIKSVSGKY